jgi:predicted nuclease with TOPRIM domain
LPELRERINWLVASFYEQSKKDEGVRERISRHDSEIENLNETVRAMRDQQARWEGALDEMIESLKRVRAAIGR